MSAKLNTYGSGRHLDLDLTEDFCGWRHRLSLGLVVKLQVGMRGRLSAVETVNSWQL